MIAFDSLSKRYKSPLGAVKTNQTTTFIIRIPSDFDGAVVEYKKIDTDFLNFVDMQYLGFEGEYKVFKAEISFLEPCVLFYNFRIYTLDGRCEFLNRGSLQQAETASYKGREWQLTVYDQNYQQPSEYAGKTMYQIFPDRFCKGDYSANTDRVVRSDWGGVPFYNNDKNSTDFIGSDFFGGNLCGIIEKLDFLKELGISVIYLNPIFLSSSNHRYNTFDYMQIDPLLGDENIFSELCKKAHSLGIKIILDGVFSHVGSDSKYFDLDGKYGKIGAYHNPDSEYRKWFTFDNSDIGYKSWWGIFSMPETNESEPSFKEFICGENGVIAHWMKLGADGVRLDVADELPDDFLDCIRNRIKAINPDAILIGEVWEDASTKHSHGGRRRYLLGNQLDGVMNYPFKAAVLNFMTSKNAYDFLEGVAHICNNYPAPILNCTMNFLSTHDTVRAVNLLSGSAGNYMSRNEQANCHLSAYEYKRGKHLFKIASTILFVLNGIPSIYYGDEAGLCGFADPFNRLCYPWGNEDLELLNFFKALCRFRTENSGILSDAVFEIVSCAENVAVFKRTNKKGTLVCAVNMSSTPVSLDKQLFKNTVFGSLDENFNLASESVVIGLI